MGKRIGLIAVLFLAVGLAFGQDLVQQSEIAFRSGNLDRALTLAEAALVKNPNSMQAHLILGVVAARRNQWDAAAQSFKTLIHIAPADPQAYFYMGQLYLYQQKWDQAAAYFTLALERNYPDRDRLDIELALAKDQGGHPSEALEILRRIHPPASGPLAAQYYAVKAFAAAKLNRHEEAINALARASRIDPYNPQYAESMISTLLNLNQSRRALAEAIEAQKRWPDDPKIQFLFGMADYFATSGQLIEVALRNLSEAQPDSYLLHSLKGLLYLRQSNMDKADEEFTEATRLGLPDSHLLLGIVYRTRGNIDAAERELREAERTAPDNGQAYLELGEALEAQGKVRDAAAQLETALRCMPQDPTVHYQLALLYARLGNKEKSEEHMRKYTQLKKQLKKNIRSLPIAPDMQANNSR